MSSDEIESRKIAAQRIDELTKELEEAKKTIEDFKEWIKERDDLLVERRESIKQLTKANAEADKVFHKQRELIDRQNGRIKELEKELEQVKASVIIANDTIDKQRELIDRLNNERVGDVVEKTQVEDIKELARILCTSPGHDPHPIEVKNRESWLQETVDGIRREFGKDTRIVWEKSPTGNHWIPIMKGKIPEVKAGERISDILQESLINRDNTPKLNIPKQT